MYTGLHTRLKVDIVASLSNLDVNGAKKVWKDIVNIYEIIYNFA